jgi:hypothetical protein
MSRSHPGRAPRTRELAVDPRDELLEEPLFLDGVVIRRWSDLARVPRPRDATRDDVIRWTDRERDAVPPAP